MRIEYLRFDAAEGLVREAWLSDDVVTRAHVPLEALESTEVRWLSSLVERALCAWVGGPLPAAEYHLRIDATAARLEGAGVDLGAPPPAGEPEVTRWLGLLVEAAIGSLVIDVGARAIRPRKEARG